MKKKTPCLHEIESSKDQMIRTKNIKLQPGIAAKSSLAGWDAELKPKKNENAKIIERYIKIK